MGFAVGVVNGIGGWVVAQTPGMVKYLIHSHQSADGARRLWGGSLPAKLVSESVPVMGPE
jgi:hypothetical protein